MLRISTSIAVAAGVLLALSGGVYAAELGEKAAVKRAVAILKGNPYGETDAEVIANLRERRLGPRADTVCGGGATRVWGASMWWCRSPPATPRRSTAGW